MGVDQDILNLTSMEYSALKAAEMLDTTSWARDFTWQQMLLMGHYFKPYSIKAGLPLFEEGMIDIYKKNKVIATLRPGRTYGEMSLIDHQPRSATAVAQQDSQLLIIDKAQFAQLSEDHPRLALTIALKIAYFLSQNLRKTSGDLSDLLPDNAD